MKSQRKTSLPLTSLASVVLGVSVSIFLSDLLFSCQLFPCKFGLRTWAILVEASFSYMIAFIIIFDINGYLNKSYECQRKLAGKKELSLFVAVCVLILIMLIGMPGLSLRYLNILFCTIFVLAFCFFAIIRKTSALSNKLVPYFWKSCVLYKYLYTIG
jgi:hypothetical protein